MNDTLANNQRLDYRTRARRAGLQHQAWQVMTKVPKITIYFWIVKILTTAMGEATSDYLVYRINKYLAVGIGALFLLIALSIQLSVKRYHALTYWLAVVGVSIFGTMAADGLHIQLGVPYLESSIFYAVVLAVIFVAWYASEKTLSIHSIYTTSRELFYWAVVLATFALGTATGDMTAKVLNLGYFSSGLLFILLFAIPGLCYWLFKINAILAFWVAYILTRPLGASFADWFGMPKYAGGLNYGRGLISLILTLIIAVFVLFLSITKKDVPAKSV